MHVENLESSVVHISADLANSTGGTAPTGNTIRSKSTINSMLLSVVTTNASPADGEAGVAAGHSQSPGQYTHGTEWTDGCEKAVSDVLRASE